MRRALRTFWRQSGGASAVEFALVATPLLLMLFGAIELGRLLWTQHALNEISVSTARCMGVRQLECTDDAGTLDMDATRAFALDRGRGFAVGLGPDDLELQPQTECGGVPGFARVAISYRFNSPLPPELLAIFDVQTLAASACFPNQA